VGWDKHAIAATKRIINERSGFPTTEEWQQSFATFQGCFGQPSVQARIPALVKAGLQSKLTFEKDVSQEALKFVGDGPFDV
jgi:hypothetical protein